MDQSNIREKNRHTVIKAAQRLFLEEGTNRTSINRIAGEAGLSATSVYRYFENKDNLIFAVWKDSLITFYNELMPYYEEKAAGLKTGYERFLCCLQCHIDIYNRFPSWLTYTREMFSTVETQPHRRDEYDSEAGKVDAYWEFYNKEIPLPILKALQDGVKDGSIRGDVNVYEVYQLVFNVYTGQNIYQYFTGSSQPTDIYALTVKMLAQYLKAESFS